jgi:pimeloyl-ACP methyl ester carboxylesterase
MRGYAKLLADHYTVYWYDRRGRGESGDASAYDIEREVEDLAAIIQAAGGSAYVFGSSSGAALALQGAVRGLPITKLLMYEAPYVDTPQGGRTAAQHAEAAWGLVRARKQGAAVRYFMCDVVGMRRLMGYAFALFRCGASSSRRPTPSPTTLPSWRHRPPRRSRPERADPGPGGRRGEKPRGAQRGGPEGRERHPDLVHQVAGGADPQPRRCLGRGDDAGVLYLSR